MPKGKNQKQKLIRILQILRSDTDENHPISTPKLIERLEEFGIMSERKSLYDDIKCLCECGFEVFTVKSNINKYYMDPSEFDDAEIKILIDCVSSARFITDKKTNALNEKLMKLLGKRKAEKFNNFVADSISTKHTNEKIYYNVDAINRAINQGVKVTFQYFDFDVNGKKILRKDGEKYVVNPVSLMFQNDNYYLVSYSDKYKNLANYRVDRMCNVALTSVPISKSQIIKNFSPQKYSKKTFSMFGGREESVDIVCDNSLVDVVVDKFGEKVKMKKEDETHFSVLARVEVCATFFSWLINFGDKIKIRYPESVAEEFKEVLQNTLKIY